MKKIFLITIVIFGFHLALKANVQDIQSINVSSTSKTVYRYKNNGVYQFAYNSGSLTLGRYDGLKSYDEETFRTIIRMDLSSIPNNALITGVSFTHSFTVEPNHFSYSINSFDYTLSGEEDEWNGAGSSYKSLIPTDDNLGPWFTYNEDGDRSFLTAIENALDDDIIAVCLVSDSEGEYEEEARKFATLSTPIVEIEYVIPKIIVENDFGGGTIRINDLTYTSGDLFETSVSASITIEASTQEYEGQTKYFDNWTNGSFSTSTNPYTYTVTKELDDVKSGYYIQTWKANFGDPINITTKNNFDGGKIIIDDLEKEAPHTFSRGKNSTVTITAKSSD